jgi:hypothetical protein
MVGKWGEKRRTPKVTTKHQIQHKKTILVVLEGIPKIDDKRMVNL